MTRDQKLSVHLEEIIFEDLPEGAHLNAKQILDLIRDATPEQRKRAYWRALERNPLLLDDEREETV